MNMPHMDKREESHSHDPRYTPMKDLESLFHSSPGSAMWHGSAMWGTSPAKTISYTNSQTAQEI